MDWSPPIYTLSATGFIQFLLSRYLFRKQHPSCCLRSSTANESWSATHHCVQPLRSSPVNAFVVRIAVFIRTCGLSSGSGPSSEADQAPPIAIGSFLPRTPTRNCSNRVGCWNDSELSSARLQDFLNRSSRGGVDSNITCNYDKQ